MIRALLVALWSCFIAINCDYTITIYPQFLKVGESSHFDVDRFNSKNGFDNEQQAPKVKQVGTFPGRWNNPDYNSHLFEWATEDPHRKGYPDPAYFIKHQNDFTWVYTMNEKQYNNPEIILHFGAQKWPHWIDTSKYKGHMPNNIDAAAEFELSFIDAVNHYTGGKLPEFVEPINEPDWVYPYVNWTTYIQFHQIVAQKVKGKFPKMKVIGPTQTFLANLYDRFDFRIWKQTQQFLDMSLTHLDAYCFHSYTNLDVRGGTHHWNGNSEAKTTGLLDLVQVYAHKKTGKGYPIVVSEYGMSEGTTGLDIHKPSTLLEWGYIYQHNAHIFTFLEHRDVIRKLVAFIMTHAEFMGQESINYSFLDKNNNERNPGQAFRFWKNFLDSMAFLRVDSQFHDAERQIVPHILMDTAKQTLYILLHNHDKHPTKVHLNFDSGWFHPTSGTSTCESLNAQKKPVLHTNTVHVTNSILTVPPESSCYFQFFHATHNFGHAQTIRQTTYYSPSMLTPINGPVDFHVYVPAGGNIAYARLRFGVSLTNKSAHTKPSWVQLNSHTLDSFYSRHTNKASTDHTVWDMYEYNIPAGALKHPGNNDVKLTFPQTGGVAATVVIVVGWH